MAKIKKIDELKSTYKGEEKISYVVHTEDGRRGYLEKNCFGKFREGDDVNVTVTKTGNGKSGAWEQWSLAMATSTPTPPPTSTPKPPSTPFIENKPTKSVDALISMKFDGRLKCMELAHNAYLAGKLDAEEAKNHCREWVTLADSLIDDLSR